MKKTFKVMLVVMAAMILLASCGGAKGAKEKDFSKAGMTITLTEDFTEKEVVSQTVTYASMDEVVMALKEEFTLFEQINMDPQTTTLEQYFDLIKTNNKAQWELKEEDGLKCFTYDNTGNGKDYSYLGVILKGNDAFWLFQFSCEKANFDSKKADFMKYAKSIKFD